MKSWELLRSYSFQLLGPLVVFSITMVLGLVLRRLVFAALVRWAQKTSGKIDDIIVKALKGPFMIWVLMLAIHLSAQISPLPEKINGLVLKGSDGLIAKVLICLLIASLTAVGAKLSSEIIRNYGLRMQGALPVTSLTQNLAQFTVVIIGLLLILGSLGISITPLLTALGVGGLAVALGLQDTLANFFAGFYVSLAGYVRLGDYIKLNSGEEGHVTDIGWRSTTIKSLSNNLIIIPNFKLSQAIVTNYYLPEKRVSFSIPISVGCDCDPDRIEAVLGEEARRAAMEVSGLLSDPAPVVRFSPGFGSSSLDFSLICHVSEFVDQYLVQHELRKRILKRFRSEGIEIPIPARTVYVREERVKDSER